MLADNKRNQMQPIQLQGVVGMYFICPAVKTTANKLSLLGLNYSILQTPYKAMALLH